MAVVAMRREQEPTRDEVLERHPGFPRLVALKIDVQRRGVQYTDRAIAAVDPQRDQLRGSYIFGSRDASLTPLPESLLLRDGTTILTDPTPARQGPYVVDRIDGRFWLVDRGEPIEPVNLWPKPAYYDRTTSSGIPMKYVVTARPQRLNIFQSSACHFWGNGNGCKFCDINTHGKQQKTELGIPTRLDPRDVAETIRAALEEPGRYTGICLTAGTDFRGAELFDREVDHYIEILQAVGENFRTRRFPSQLIGTAFNERQLARLHAETGLTSYTSDIEVLDERVFGWVCPGKAEKVGYHEWKRRLVAAVGIFGRGNVGTGLVGGVELAQPNGFSSEEDALTATLAEAEDLAQQGVTTVYIVWVPRPGSPFRDQRNASLDYYLRLANGLHGLRVKYGLSVDFDDYRRCGNHPDSDLSRLL